MKFVTLSMIERGAYNEDTGEHGEASKPTIVNASCIRCFYARKDGKPGTRITFNDGGGFAVSEPVDAVALAVAGGEVAAQLAPASTN
jgi:hypothetical protein